MILNPKTVVFVSTSNHVEGDPYLSSPEVTQQITFVCFVLIYVVLIDLVHKKQTNDLLKVFEYSCYVSIKGGTHRKCQIRNAN